MGGKLGGRRPGLSLARRECCGRLVARHEAMQAGVSSAARLRQRGRCNGETMRIHEDRRYRASVPWAHNVAYRQHCHAQGVATVSVCRSEPSTVARTGRPAVLGARRHRGQRAAARLTLSRRRDGCVSSGRSMPKPRTGAIECSGSARLSANREAGLAQRGGRELRPDGVGLLAPPTSAGAWNAGRRMSGERDRAAGAKVPRVALWEGER